MHMRFCRWRCAGGGCVLGVVMARMWSFFVPGPLPGLNEIITANKQGKSRSGKFLIGLGYTNMKAEWGKQIVKAIRDAKIPPLKRVRVMFQWMESKKNRDPDNIAAGKKFIFDALVDAGVLENDGWKQVAGFTDVFIIGRPGVEVSVRDEIEEAIV